MGWGAGAGAVGGAAAGYAFPNGPGGWNFDPWNSPATWGPKAQQLYWQAIYGGETASGVCSLFGRKC